MTFELQGSREGEDRTVWERAGGDETEGGEEALVSGKTVTGRIQIYYWPGSIFWIQVHVSMYLLSFNVTIFTHTIMP